MVGFDFRPLLWIIGVIFFIAIGVSFVVGYNSSKISSKTKIIPVITIITVDGVSDTTFIYKIK